MERINDTAQNEKGAHGVMNIEALSVKYGKKRRLTAYPSPYGQGA